MKPVIPDRDYFFLIAALLMMPIQTAFAQAINSHDWTEWNTVSPAIFPTQSWMQYETPEEAGWSSEKLTEVQQLSKRAKSAAVTVIYNGAILTQWGQTERRFKIHSVAKSILSALYGIAVDSGEISLDETIGSLGIDDITRLTELEKSAKVSDLLKARSGVYLPAAGESAGMRRARFKRGSYKPGTQWSYNGWDFDVLGTIYNQKTSDDMFKTFDRNLATPLQMQDFNLRHAYYNSQPNTSRHPWYSIRSSARDQARFGLLYLNKGKWMNKQIIPPDWVQESITPHSTHSVGGYGYLWWTFPEQSRLGKLGSYAALGNGGHAIYVVPKANLVFVHRANTYDRWQFVMSNSIENILIGILQARTGPAQPKPKFIVSDIVQTDSSRMDLTETEISALAGTFYDEFHRVTIQQINGRLEYTHPNTGSFLLSPKTPTVFELEDAQWRLEFTLDATGKASSLRIWIRPDESFKFQKVADDDKAK
ncbi:MAG: CubicO group peptidase (beta-lactamase class C family) [Gammaproteobacteria bacterium]|jgi:CubicO group peptidase (beta-lactamase class C family)